jgi:hypothetical protein
MQGWNIDLWHRNLYHALHYENRHYVNRNAVRRFTERDFAKSQLSDFFYDISENPHLSDSHALKSVCRRDALKLSTAVQLLAYSGIRLLFCSFYCF